MSYMNNDDYLRFSRTEEYQTNLKNANFDLTKVLKDQNNDAAGYDGLWGEGIKMNWTKVPLEEQRCHINWRQSINDDGIALSSTLLASWMEQGGNINGGSINGVSLTSTNNNEEKANVYEENQKDMSKNEHQNNEDYGEYIKSAIQFAKDKREKGEHLMSSDHETVKKLLGNATDLDAFAVIAAAIALDKENDYSSIISTYRQYATSLNTTNPVLIWTAVGTSDQIVKAYLDGTLDSDGKVTSSTVTSKKTSITEPVIKGSPTSTGNGKDVGKVEYLVIHHSGGSLDSPPSAFIGKYHFLIYSNGDIYYGTDEHYQGENVGAATGDDSSKGINAHGQKAFSGKDYNEVYHEKAELFGGNRNNLSISFPGTFIKGASEPTEAQINSLIQLCAHLCKKYSIEPIRANILGHYEVYDGLNSNTGCPGYNVSKHLDSIVQAVASGSLSMTVKLWTQFVAVIKKGLENSQTTAKVSGLDLFPKICFLYVALEASSVSTVSTSFDTQEWGFPFSDEDIRQHGNGTIIVTDIYGTKRDYGGHSGVDLQPQGKAYAFKSTDPDFNEANFINKEVPVRAMNDGEVIEAINDLSSVNEITIVHSGNRMSRYKHCYGHVVQVGDKVKRGQKISHVSGVGGGSSHAYAFHLHVEIGTGTNLQNYKHDNPMKFWNGADNTDNGGYDRARFKLSS